MKVNLVIDELYQLQHTEAFLTQKLSRLAKYSAKPILSCHYINQLKIIRDELRSARRRGSIKTTKVSFVKLYKERNGIRTFYHKITEIRGVIPTTPSNFKKEQNYFNTFEF